MHVAFGRVRRKSWSWRGFLQMPRIKGQCTSVPSLFCFNGGRRLAVGKIDHKLNEVSEYISVIVCVSLRGDPEHKGNTPLNPPYHQNRSYSKRCLGDYRTPALLIALNRRFSVYFCPVWASYRKICVLFTNFNLTCSWKKLYNSH